VVQQRLLLIGLADLVFARAIRKAQDAERVGALLRGVAAAHACGEAATGAEPRGATRRGGARGWQAVTRGSTQASDGVMLSCLVACSTLRTPEQRESHAPRAASTTSLRRYEVSKDADAV
jgi:hypothetical protein